MKAVAVFPGTRQVRLVEHEAPRIRTATDVQLRMLEVGVCGTDREIAAFEYGTPPAGSDHLVIGHESLGEVVAVGAGVTRVEPGDLVVTMVRRPCDHADCAACRAGRQDFCFTGDYAERGIKSLHGFMTETVVDDERYMHVVPRALRDVGILVEPLTIAEKALIQVNQVQERLPWICGIDPSKRRQSCHRAVVLGAGPVGLLGTMALLTAGFETYVYAREPVGHAKSLLCEAIGARYFSSSDSSLEQLAERVGNVDLVYEATGAASVAFEMLRYLGTNAIYVFTGVPGRKAPIELDADTIMRRLVLNNQLVFGTVNAGHEAFEAAVRDLSAFVEQWPAAVRALITARQPAEAFRDLLVGPSQGIKNVITFT